MQKELFPKEIPNWIDRKQSLAVSGELFDKTDPANGKLLSRAARSRAEDVHKAVEIAKKAQVSWAETPPVQRGKALHSIVLAMQARRKEIAKIVAKETGKSNKDADSEVSGAIDLGLFFAGEGQRLYGRTITSAIPNKYVMTIRQAIGVAGLIVPANTPIANVAWKVFPALICGNTVVLKASEDAPATAWFFGRIAHEAGIAPGVLNIIQGYGEEAGVPLVENPDVAIISFTGSTKTGRQIAMIAGKRLIKVSLELGGKNPFIVCDDADFEKALDWALLSIFSNAGQRCASASRIIIFDAIYEKFKAMLIERTKKLKVGPTDEDDLGPVINERQLKAMLAGVKQARQAGATILIGGDRLTGLQHRDGYYMAPTLIENAHPDAEISKTELFGPIACLYRVKDFDQALALANSSPYGLTACIHTRSLQRATRFSQKIQAGVAVVNAGTYGSEPHMPFGGLKQSGNGWREPGTEALGVYSELKTISISVDTNQL